MLSIFGTSCKHSCAPSDPVQDTVKVDMSTTPPVLHVDEEADQMARSMAEEESRRAAVAAEEAIRAAEEAKSQRLAEEQRVLQEKIARERREDLERQRQLAQEAAEAERRRQEQAVIETQRIEDENNRKATVAKFLKENGFKGGVNDGKRGIMSTVYPLHFAAEHADEKMVRMLLEEGADPRKLNSSKKTAVQIAQKKDKKGSHAGVLSLLGGVGVSVVGGA